ncbi:DM13 domain-containing protein [Hellea sp.]|nr:DM13 domain-containing protein [Hellea sp.]
MKYMLKIALLTSLVAVFSTPALAQSSEPDRADTPPSHTFVKKRYNIDGTWDISKVNGLYVLNFHDDFKTKGGPDLKVFLSKKPLAALNGSNVTPISVKLGVLKSNHGAQSYTISPQINLSEYKSIVIHCEVYSILWGGFDIAENL